MSDFGEFGNDADTSFDFSSGSSSSGRSFGEFENDADTSYDFSSGSSDSGSSGSGSNFNFDVFEDDANTDEDIGYSGLDGSDGDIPPKPDGMLGTATWEGTTQTWIANDEEGNSVTYDRDGNVVKGAGPGFDADGKPMPGSPYTLKMSTGNAASLAKTLKDLGLLGSDGKLSTQGALIGTGIAALMSYLNGGKSNSGTKAAPYVQAPLYNRGFTAPMKDPISNATYYFDRNPFNMDPDTAGNIQGPSEAEAKQQREAYQAGLAEIYSPKNYGYPEPTVPQAYAGSQYVEGAPPKKMMEGGTVTPFVSPEDSPYFLSPSAPQPREVLSYKAGNDNQSGSEYAKGGYLNGPGDGMSDHIPATIDNKQPAKLSDGEFVLPADIVASIGNGSNKAGSKKLYAIMNKIRQVKYGRSQQPPKMSDQGIAKLFTG